MLTTGERYILSWTIAAGSIAGIFPFDIHVRTGKLHQLSLFRRSWRWLCFSISAAHLLYANYRFATLYLTWEPLEVPAYLFYSICVTHILLNGSYDHEWDCGDEERGFEDSGFQ